MANLFRFLLIMSSGMFAIGQSQSAKQPFVIAIAAESQAVNVGSEVAVTVRLKNTSNHELDFSANISDLTGVDPNYTFEVWDGEGRPVSRRVYAHPELATGHAVFRTVKPGDSIVDTEPVSRLLDVRKPGKYVIQVSRHTGEADESVVKSNKITVAVTP